MDQSTDFRIKVIVLGTKHLFGPQKCLVGLLVFLQEKIANAFQSLILSLGIAVRG